MTEWEISVNLNSAKYYATVELWRNGGILDQHGESNSIEIYRESLSTRHADHVYALSLAYKNGWNFLDLEPF